MMDDYFLLTSMVLNNLPDTSLKQLQKAVFVSFSSDTQIGLMVRNDSPVAVSMCNVVCRDLLYCWDWISSRLRYFRNISNMQISRVANSWEEACC